MNTTNIEKAPGTVPTIERDEPVITINDLGKSFGKQEVLKKVSLQLKNGESLVVLGKSGSGKSVLIKCIVRLLHPDSGTIRVLGMDVAALSGTGLSDLRVKIGFLFQNGALYDSMTVRQNLEFPLLRIKKHRTSKEMEVKVAEVLEQVGLSDAIDKMPSQLSGGMRKRISLARTIIVDPLIMLYDEPTTGLDPETSGEISSLINAIQKRYSTSSIVITHDMECVRATANRVIMLRDGEVYKEGTLESFERSNDGVIVPFFKQDGRNHEYSNATV